MPKLTKARQQELQDIKALMGRPEGVRFVKRLLALTGIFPLVSSFVPGGIEGERASCFNEGRRNVGITIQADIMEVCPQHINLMQSVKADKEDGKSENHVIEKVV